MSTKTFSTPHTASPVRSSTRSGAGSESALSHSSLASAREAIARWTVGTVRPVRAAGQHHVSAQQRWCAQAQRDLAAWIDNGGFGQDWQPGETAAADAAPLLIPAMYSVPRELPIGTAQENADACME